MSVFSDTWLLLKFSHTVYGKKKSEVLFVPLEMVNSKRFKQSGRRVTDTKYIFVIEVDLLLCVSV